MEEVETITSHYQEFKNSKEFDIKIGELNYIFSISENNTDIKFVINQKEGIDLYEYEEHYNLDKLIKINDIFKMFNSINSVRKSFENLLNSKKYTFIKSNENIEFILKLNIFEEIREVSLYLKKKKLKKEDLENIVNRQKIEIKELKTELDNLKIKHDREINELKEEIKQIKAQNKKMFILNQEVLFKNQKEDFSFCFRKGINYTLNKNGKIAEKTSGGNDWNCTIVGDIQIPKNKISRWKIKLKKFKIDKQTNTVNTFIGIGPNNPQNKRCFYNFCWTLSCGENKILSRNDELKFNNYPGNLKEGDIIEVIVDMSKGTLSFKINNIDYGLTCSNIPKNEELYPIVLINDINQMFEILG